MSNQPLDIEAIKLARTNLDRIARDHPHLIDPNGAMWSEKDISEMIDEKQTAYTVEEAASLLRCHAQTIRRAIKNGKLQAAKIGKGIAISRFDLEDYYQAKGGGRLFDGQPLNAATKE